jgi:hypothetical protein
VRRSAWLVVAIVVVVGAGCKDEQITSGTCDFTGIGGGCSEFDSVGSLGEIVKSACESNGGVWSGDPCPGGYTGYCEYSGNGISGRDYYYDVGTAAADQQYCVDNGGAWTPGPT